MMSQEIKNSVQQKMARKKKIFIWIIAVLICLTAVAAVLVANAPRIVSSDKVKESILAEINKTPGVNLQIRKLYLRWFRESRIEGVAFSSDIAGKTVVESIVLTKGLKPFASRRIDFGEIIINRPKLTMIVPEALQTAESVPPEPQIAGGEAVQSVTKPAAAGAEQSSGPAPQMSLKVPVDLKGSIKVRNASVMIGKPGSEETVLENIELDVSFKWLENPVTAQFSASQGSGSINAALSLGGFPDRAVDLDKIKSSIQLAVNKLELEPLSRLGSSWAVPEIAGQLNADIRASTDGIHKANLNAKVRAQNILVSTTGKFRPKPLDLIEIRADIAMDGKNIEIKTAAVDSAAVRINASGSLVDQGLSLPSGSITANSDINVAKLAQIVPELLRVREDLEVTGGTIAAKAVIDSDGRRMAVSGNAGLTGLSGISAGRSWTLSKPVTAAVKAQFSDGNLNLDELKCDSSFATVSASGDAKAMTALFSADIAAGIAELSKFISLDKASAAGLLNGKASIRRLSNKDDWQVNLQVNGENMAAGAPDKNLNLRSLVINASTALEAGIADIDLKASGKSLEISSGKISTTEPAVDLLLKAEYSLPDDLLTIGKLSLNSITLSTLLSGKIADVKTDKDADIDGVFTCDYARLGGILAAASGKDIRMSGKREENLHIKGKLGLTDKAAMMAGLNASAGVFLEKLWLFGMDMRDVDFKVNVQDGAASALINTQLNKGKVELSPRIEIVDAIPVLTLPDNSRVLQNVNLTDEMVNELLAIMHPLLKNCAAAGGRVDLLISNCRVPLDDAMQEKMSIAGTLYLKDAAIAPEGLLKQLLELARLEQRAVSLDKQSLSFVARDGKIETSPLKLGGGSSEITISGSVGLDGKLNYTADTPVTEKMVGSDIFPYLKGTTIKVPIRGTVSKPEISVTEFNRMLAQMVAEAGKKAIKEKGAEELNRLLKDKGGKLLEDLLRAR